MSSELSNSERQKWTQLGVSRKRKEWGRLDADAHLPHVATKVAPLVLTALLSAQQQQQQPQPPTKPTGAGGNKLLAGYPAHQFLTKGTLFGKHWEPATAAAARPLTHHQPKAKESIKWKPSTAPEKPPMAYVEVAQLLKMEAAYIPGVVNPT